MICQHALHCIPLFFCREQKERAAQKKQEDKERRERVLREFREKKEQQEMNAFKRPAGVIQTRKPRKVK